MFPKHRISSIVAWHGVLKRALQVGHPKKKTCGRFKDGPPAGHSRESMATPYHTPTGSEEVDIRSVRRGVSTGEEDGRRPPARRA
jgi:hypothetical protein